MLTARDNELIENAASIYAPQHMRYELLAQYAALDYYINKHDDSDTILHTLIRMAAFIRSNYEEKDRLVVASTAADLKRIFPKYRSFYDWGVSYHYYWNNETALRTFRAMYNLTGRRRLFLAYEQEINHIKEIVRKWDGQTICQQCHSGLVAENNRCALCGDSHYV